MSRLSGVAGVAAVLAGLTCAATAEAQCCQSPYPTFVRPAATAYYGPSLFDTTSFFGPTTAFYGSSYSSFYGPTYSSFYSPSYSSFYAPSVTAGYGASTGCCCPSDCCCPTGCCGSGGCASGNCPGGNCGVNYGPDDLKPQPDPASQPAPDRTFDSDAPRTFDRGGVVDPRSDEPLDNPPAGNNGFDNFDRFDRGAEDDLDRFDAFRPIEPREKAPTDLDANLPETELGDPVEAPIDETDLDNSTLWNRPLDRGPELGPSVVRPRRKMIARFRAPQLASFRPWQSEFDANGSESVIGIAKAK